MIYGAKEWDNKFHYYSQQNNPTEEILRKVDLEDGDKDHDWLESCGPTAAINCMAVQGHNLEIKCPGIFSPQPEEVLTDYFNDPRNYQKFQDIRSNMDLSQWMGNRVPQFYSVAIMEVFGVVAKFGYLQAEQIIDRLLNGETVQVCLKNPGHYIAVVAYDDSSREFIINDSWGSRPGNINNGFNERISYKKFGSSIQPYAITYEPK